ncbi:MAG: hypothetical protein L0Y36_08560, partial [Planctomycetales bacterium]|nr:hypothetical protein [Planctomycetales bacterium]
MKNILFIAILLCFGAAGCASQAQTETVAAPASVQTTSVRIQSLKPRALVILEGALKSNNAYLRNHAVEVVVQTGRKEFLPQVVKLTTDPSVAVRFAATAAL